MNTNSAPNTIQHFYHSSSGTFTYVVFDNTTKDAVVIDPVLDYQLESSTTCDSSVLPVINFIKENALTLHYVFETHAHADHVTGAQALKALFNVPVVIGKGITQVQKKFKEIYHLETAFNVEGQQFDLLVEDGQSVQAGTLTIKVLATPGHTNDSVTYLIGDAAFVGDTLFHPDIGTARCDFPGGCAADLYDSIQKILSLPKQTTLYLCHDYPPATRKPVAQTSIEYHQHENKHIKTSISKETYVALRRERDLTLDLPKLIIPSIQINIRAGKFPAPEENGVSYLKYPLNSFKK